MKVQGVSRRDAIKLGALGLSGGVGCSGLTPSVAAARSIVTPAATASRRTVAALAPEVSFTLAFGSCNRSDLPQPLWSDIRALEPDVWAWLGDNVYADTDDIRHTRRLYREQAGRADYAALVAQTHVVGIWDDHDWERAELALEARGIGRGAVIAQAIPLSALG